MVTYIETIVLKEKVLSMLLIMKVKKLLLV